MARGQVVVASALAALLLICRTAQAEQGRGFSQQYPAVLTLENLAGVAYVRTQIAGSDPSSYAEVGTSMGPFYGVDESGPLLQLGFHYFVLPPLSLGLGVHYGSRDESGTTLELEPRVGLAIPLDGGTAIWLRAGATYFNYKSGTGSLDETLSGFAPGGEALLVLQPVEHFGFLIGARCLASVGARAKGEALSLSGSSSANSKHYSLFEAGLSIGVLSDF